MGFFSSDIKITGKHATILQKYSMDKNTSQDVKFMIKNVHNKDSQMVLFDTRFDGFLIACLLGIILNKKSNVDSNNHDSTSTIFTEKINKHRDMLSRLRTYMILIENKNEEIDSTIKKAFSLSNDEKDAIDQKNMEAYVRGGLEYIDSLFNDVTNTEDVLNTLYDVFSKLKIEDNVF